VAVHKHRLETAPVVSGAAVATFSAGGAVESGDRVTNRERIHAQPDRFDDARDFMARRGRKLHPGIASLPVYEVAKTDAAGGDAHDDFSRAGHRGRDIGQHEGRIGRGNLDGAHGFSWARRGA
jgi:hypothetical protein